MISLRFENINTLFNELENKIDGVNQLITKETESQLAKAVFTITTKKFIKDFGIEAALNPKKYFHMYEWNSVGNPSKKLFSIKRQSASYGNLKIAVNYKQSRTPVPIPGKLQESRNKNKRVKKRSVFVNKAEIMETGKPVSFTTKQYIAFLSQKDGKVRFVAPGKTVRISNPGGNLTKGAFDKFLTTWYANKVESAVSSSGMIDMVGKRVATSLNQKGGGKVAAKEAIRIVAESYSQGVTEL
jgi:hypothetical protein